MSTFLVEVRKIEKIWNHPNADKLQLGKVDGLDFQFVIQKDNYKVGDKVIYFPVDSLFPSSLIERFDLNYLSGSDKNRVKTIKLRGEYSQGLVLPLYKFDGLVDLDSDIGTDVTTQLGITKYEPEPILCNAARLITLPDGVSVYDIEGFERYPQSVNMLMDISCIITEKLEGTNFSIVRKKSGEILVNTRRYNIVEEGIDGKVNIYWESARRNKLIEFIESIFIELQNTISNMVVVRGELIGPGIQKNIYKLDSPKMYVFDIQVDGEYLDFYKINHLYRLINPEHIVPWAPIISVGKPLREFLDGRTITEAANGYSLLNKDTLREGIVIKPMNEMYSKELDGRLILKKRDLIYLEKYGF